jgi:hypothetical protein
VSEHNYKPDVLSCIANLSSDEVFTPPQLVNQILDVLPADLWSDKKSTFLDPGCKSGVFLREIVKRLDKGLEKYIANRQKRLDHIFKNQVFGLAITELTALLSRRSLYCSETANGKYSVCEAFDNPEGNIRFGRVEHAWDGVRCVNCGASRENYERGGDRESMLADNRLRSIDDYLSASDVFPGVGLKGGVCATGVVGPARRGGRTGVHRNDLFCWSARNGRVAGGKTTRRTEVVKWNQAGWRQMGRRRIFVGRTAGPSRSGGRTG